MQHPPRRTIDDSAVHKSCCAAVVLVLVLLQRCGAPASGCPHSLHLSLGAVLAHSTVSIAHGLTDDDESHLLQLKARNAVRRALREQFAATAPITVHTLPQPVRDMESLHLLDSEGGRWRLLSAAVTRLTMHNSDVTRTATLGHRPTGPQGFPTLLSDLSQSMLVVVALSTWLRSQA